MAKKSTGGKGAEKINRQANHRMANIETAAKSLAAPRSYEKGGYPAYPETLHINRDVTKKARISGED